MSEQKTLFTNEQLLQLAKNWACCFEIGTLESVASIEKELLAIIPMLEHEIDKATVEQLMPTILEGLPNLNRNDFPYSLPDDLEDAFGINHWTNETWGQHLDEMGYVEYPIHAPMSDEVRRLGKDGEFQSLNLEFHRLFPVERFNEIRQWAKKVYGWDCDIHVSIEICRELTWDGLSDEEVTDAWGYLYVGPHVPRKRDLPSLHQQEMLQGLTPVLPMNMSVTPFGDEKTFLEWLVYGMGEWYCTETNIADCDKFDRTIDPNNHLAEIEYIKGWWLAMTGTRMENVFIDDCWIDEDGDGCRCGTFNFTINRDDIRAVYGHLELPKSEVTDILRRHEQEDWRMEISWFGKTIEDEPVEFGPSNVDGPVELIMDQIDRLNPEQLDMLLERIHAKYNVGHTLSSMVKAVVLGMNA